LRSWNKSWNAERPERARSLEAAANLRPPYPN
jgi:hypothetical protein